jgi:hypothetical protein
MSLVLRLHAGEYAACRLPANSALPAWAANAPGFCSVTRTPAELSIICTAEQVPSDIRHERDWTLVELVGPFPFEAVGILSSVLGPLAQAKISCLAVATFDTDYVLVKSGNLPAALAALERAGHRFE